MRDQDLVANDLERRILKGELIPGKKVGGLIERPEGLTPILINPLDMPKRVRGLR